MALIPVDGSNFQDILSKELERGNTVILKFGSEYCDACMSLGFELEELDEEVDNVSILDIDCNESREIAQAYEIRELPTMFIYKDKNSIPLKKVGIVLAPDIKEILLK